MPYFRFRLALVAVVLLGCIAFSWMMYSAQTSAIRESQEFGDAADPIPEGPLGEVETLRRQRKPEEAMDKLRPLVASGNEAARKMMPACLNDLYQKRVQKKEWEKAREVAMEAADWAEAGQEAGWVLKNWPQDRMRWADEAAKAEDDATAARVYAEVFAGGPVNGGVYYLLPYRDWRLDQWKRTGSEEALEEAAAVHADSWNPVADALKRKLSAPELESRADKFLSAGRPEAALTFYEAAFEVVPRADEEGKKRLRARWEECRLLTARGAREGKIPTVSPRYVKDLYRRVDESPDPGRKYQALHGLLELAVDEGLEALDRKDYRGAEQAFREALDYHTTRAFEASFDVAGLDPWAGVPAEILKKVEANSDPKVPGTRQSALMSIVRSGEWRPTSPVARRIEAVLPDMYAAWGISELDRNPQTALQHLRYVMRLHADTEAARRAIAGLQQSIRAAVAAGNFPSLFALCGFYIAEAPPPVETESFRNELASALVAAADSFRNSSPMKRLFMLSLLADAFPSDPRGIEARIEALNLGLDAVAKAPVQADGAELSIPMGDRGFSAVSNENATEYHILIFYDGPEQFWVRLNPYRKGTVVLKDGKYRVGVVAAADDITPYRGDLSYEAKTYWANYVVERGGKQRPLFEGAEATGDFSIIRAPKNEAGFVVEPKSGLVTRGGK